VPLTDLVGGGFDLPVGAWTDDTSMALCLGESLIECGGFDPADQLERYVRWWHEGHLSSTGRCFDIGGTVRNALLRFERTRDPESGSTDPSTAGNGSLMRLAPVVLAFAPNARDAVQMAAASSRTTHAAREAVDACRYLAGLIAGALRGESTPLTSRSSGTTTVRCSRSRGRARFSARQRCTLTRCASMSRRASETSNPPCGSGSTACSRLPPDTEYARSSSVRGAAGHSATTPT
jgi:ADP-ribosylglycohydrolase